MSNTNNENENKYDFNPAFKREKLLALNPAKSISLSSVVADIPVNWLAKLETLCRTVNPGLPLRLFNSHIGGSYTHKEELINTLKLIYFYFVATDSAHALSDDRRRQLIDLLTQDITACTPGFHNRANLVVGQLLQPESLEQLLHTARESIVSMVTQKILTQQRENKIPIGNQIHFGNYVEIIAKKLGLGVNPTLATDPHGRDLNLDKQIKEELKKAFERYLTPFNLPFLLATQIEGLLATSGYSGFKQDGYTMGEVDKFILTIGKFIPSPHEHKNEYIRDRYFHIEMDEDGIPLIFHDIKWSVLRKDLFQALKNEGYFKEPEPRSLKDFIQRGILNELEGFGIFNENISLLITDITGFALALKNLSADQRTVLFDACKDSLPAIIKDESDLMTLLIGFTVEQRSVVLEACKDRLPSIIKDASEFSLTLIGLTVEQRAVVFEACKDLLPSIIKDASDFSWAIQHLTVEQRAVVFDACKDLLPSLITDGYNFNQALEYLSADQRSVVFDACKDLLPSIIKDGDRFGIGFGFALQNLSVEQCSVVIDACKDLLPSIIKDGYNFNQALKNLSVEQCSVVIDACKDLLPSIIKDACDFNQALQDLSVEQCSVVIDACKDLLPSIIKDGYNFKQALENLPADQRSVVFDACKDLLPSIIKNDHDFRWVIKCLDSEKQVALCKILQTQLRSLFKNESVFSDHFDPVIKETVLDIYKASPTPLLPPCQNLSFFNSTESEAHQTGRTSPGMPRPTP